jgi:hypothetical protein
MNGDNPPKNHTRFIVGGIVVLGILSAGSGTFLMFKGFQSGELMVQITGQAVAGLLGFLGGKSMSTDNVKISNPPTDPVPVAPQPDKQPIQPHITT